MAQTQERAITLRPGGLDDWYVIEWAEHEGRMWIEPTAYGGSLRTSGRLGNADIEGTAHEMRALAVAIERRERQSFRRCAVEPLAEGWHIWSPRNSIEPSLMSDVQATHLAAEIRRVLAPAQEPKS